MENNSAQRSSHIAQYAKYHPGFITVTCLEWKPVLQDDRFKEIIISSLSFLSKANRVTVYAFVIMDNHFHLIWQIMNEHTREAVQRDFLRYTSQQILKILRNEQSRIQYDLLVNARDRKHQVWGRNSLSISLWSSKVLWQKIDYIHQNRLKLAFVNTPKVTIIPVRPSITAETGAGISWCMLMGSGVGCGCLLVKNTNKGMALGS